MKTWLGAVGLKVNSSFIPSTIIYLIATFHYLRALGGENSKMSPIAARVVEIVVAVAATLIIFYAFRAAFNIAMP